MNPAAPETPAVERCEVAILAGGLGTRLKSRTGNLPKPLAPLAGATVLDHLLALCARHGFRRVALLIHYNAQAIQDHVGDGSRWGLSVDYAVETQARGTAGALRDALPLLADRFLVLYGDTYADVDLRSVWQAHERSGAAGTLLLHPNDHPHDSDLIELDGEGAVRAVRPYPHPEGHTYANLVNAALYVLQADAVRQAAPADGSADLAKHSFPAMLAAGLRLRGFVTPEYIKDIGTPERLDKVEQDMARGTTQRLSARQLRTAVFLDRDGTLNREVGHLRDAAQLALLPGAAEAVRALNRAGVLAVCVTNQPVLARGDVDAAGLARIHARLDHLLGEGRAYLDRIYHCPHHPDRGFPGEVAALKIACDCRKPRTGLIDRAVHELQVERQRSWMVGDTLTDIQAGRDAGLRTILVRTGHAGQDGRSDAQPDYTVPDIASAVDWVLGGHAALGERLLPLLPEAWASRLVLVGGPARTGKSSVAQRLAEQLRGIGRGAHVLGLDGWLRDAGARNEGEGVLARYDLDAAVAALAPLLAEPGVAHGLAWPVYERGRRQVRLAPPRLVSPGDVLIVEGVPALLAPAWRGQAPLRLHVDAEDSVRRARAHADYAWRGREPAATDAVLDARELDEVALVRDAARWATHRL